MVLTPQEYARQVEDLFVLPDIYLKLKEIMDDKKSSLSDIAEVVVLDPSLSSTLLKLANSALFSFPREIDSIARAIMVLGIKEVHNLVNLYGVTNACSNVETTIVDMDRFWEVSVDCALLCKFFAQKLKLKDVDGLFLSGLMHNIGELVVVQSSPKQVEFCQKYNKEETPWQLQMDVFGFTYSECSVELLNLWQLPESLIEPIRHYHNIKTESDVTSAAKLLNICSRLALINSHPGMYSKQNFVMPSLLEEFELSITDIDEALNFCNVEGLTIMSALALKNS
ncbi:HDOD domain-containing protein [Pseudocolwellia agarivorans]|uniref:HDOD domain-containing protein n=1 Tax=Pseudocolwellia agarivorans TaxID=1911682 RepID=UPI000985F8F1|nr:HDOD domain-containing protein [Pseudocolwellia agarivorans]